MITLAIREIFNYIESHRGDIPDEKIRESLEKKGYPEDEIDAAFLMSRNAKSSPDYSGGTEDKKKIAPMPQRPTLWGAVARGQESADKKIGSGGIPAEPIDIAARNKRRFLWESIIGFLMPGGFYLLGLIIFTFIELLFFVPDIAQISSMGMSIVVSFGMHLWLKKAEAGFSKGLAYGISVIAIVLAYTLIAGYFNF